MGDAESCRAILSWFLGPMQLAELLGLRSPKSRQTSYVFVLTETVKNSFGAVWFHGVDAYEASKNAFLHTPLAFDDYLAAAMRTGEGEAGNNKRDQGSLLEEHSIKQQQTSRCMHDNKDYTYCCNRSWPCGHRRVRGNQASSPGTGQSAGL